MFARTFRTIETDTDGRSGWVLLVLGALVAAWLAWFCLAPVTIYESSLAARLEMSSAAHPVEVEAAGRVVAVNQLELSRAVTAGEVLLELDAQAQRLELGEAQARELSLDRQCKALREEIRLEREALEVLRQQSEFAIAEANNRQTEGAVMALAARREAARQRQLLESGATSQAEHQRHRAEADGRRAASAALRAQVGKVTLEANAGQADGLRRVAALELDLARLEGELAIERAKLSRLEHQLALRQLRAPAAGTLSEVGNVRVGSLLKEGDRVATVLASDSLQVVAELPPAGVFGRVREGQAARIEFDGFPWVEYGLVDATVRRVAGEVREGRARVELSLDLESAKRIPLQHGLPARVSIAIERATPGQLVLRAVGKLLGPGRRVEGTP